MQIERIGVIGAGVMGRGVSTQLLATGHRVVLVDQSVGVLDEAVEDIRLQLRLLRLMARTTERRGPGDQLTRLQCTVDDTELSDVDFVIENVTEKWTVKQQVYERLEQICRPECPWAANTSAIPIARFARLTQRPDRVIGVHFMNPVPAKPTVEVIRAITTSETTFAATLQLLQQMGKSSIVVGDTPGFVSNRVLMLAINEAIHVVDAGTAPPADVDRVFRECFGHPMGPLETADLIGLDTVLLSLEVLRDEYGDDKFTPAASLKKLVAERRLGRKAGHGFYVYETDPVPVTASAQFQE